MRDLGKLFICGAVCAVADVDCSAYSPWGANTVGNPPVGGWKVYKDSNAYSASTWVDASNVPGSSTGGAWSPWSDEGACIAGTAGAGSASESGPGDATVDCTSFRPWTTELSGNPPAGGWKVHRAGSAFTASTWVDGSNVPGEAAGGWSPWTRVGGCVVGSEGSNESSMETVDCTDVFQWDPYTTYTKEGGKVHNEGRLYKINYWSNGVKPSPAGDGPWSVLGVCSAGTDSLGPEVEHDPIAQWKLDLTCKCCTACGTIQNGQVVCTDVSEENCYFKWCGESSEQDADECQSLINHEKFRYWDGSMGPSKAAWPTHVYAPYFDSGLYGWPPLSTLVREYGINHFIVAFVVSTSSPILQTGECQGAFAGAISVEAGPTYEHEGQFFYLYDELNKVRELGGDFVISFGGANGIELADAAECQVGDPAATLAAEYGRILDLTNSNRIDFDIEGNAYSAINEATGWTYRFNALKLMKQQRPDLHVTWTLPILPTGLTGDGVKFFEKLMRMDAPFDLINVMNMDYGECPTICDNDHIDACERDAIDNLTQQLFQVAQQTGQASKKGWNSADDVYSFVGSTPMVGKNDITCLVYTLEAAKTNLEYFKQKNLGLISNWSIARDAPCPSAQSVSVDCSSYDGQTSQFEFAKIWAPFTSAD